MSISTWLIIGNPPVRAVGQSRFGFLPAGFRAEACFGMDRQGQGRSGGYRTFMAFRVKERTVFVYGFAKNALCR